MERRSVPMLLTSLAVTVSMTACTADQLASIANQVLANADVYLNALSNGQLSSMKPSDLAEMLVNGTGIDINKLQTGTNGQLKVQGLKKGENLLKIKKKGSNEYITVPVVVNEDGTLTIVAQAEFDANGNPIEVSGGQADASGNLSETGYAFKQSGNNLFYRDPKAGNMQQFDLRQGQFRPGQGQIFQDPGQDAFRAKIPKVTIKADRQFQGQLVAMKIGDNVPPPFAFKFQDGNAVADIAAFGPALRGGQVPRPPVTIWVKGADNAFKKFTIELQQDVQGPKGGGMQQGQPQQGQQQPGMQQPGMQQPGMQQPGMQQQPGGMMPPPGGTQPPRFGFLSGFGFSTLQTQSPPPPGGTTQPPPPPPGGQQQPGMQPPPGGQQQPGMQPPPGGQQQPGMQPPPGGQQPQNGQPPQGGMQPGGMQQPQNGQPQGGMQQGQPPMDPFAGLPAMQTIDGKVTAETAATEADLPRPQQQGGQPPQGGQQPGGQQQPGGMPPQGGQQQPGGMPPQGGQQQGMMPPPPGGQPQQQQTPPPPPPSGAPRT